MLGDAVLAATAVGFAASVFTLARILLYSYRRRHTNFVRQTASMAKLTTELAKNSTPKDWRSVRKEVQAMLRMTREPSNIEHSYSNDYDGRITPDKMTVRMRLYNIHAIVAFNTNIPLSKNRSIARE